MVMREERTVATIAPTVKWVLNESLNDAKAIELRWWVVYVLVGQFDDQPLISP
jgi:hypothetical protein